MSINRIIWLTEYYQLKRLHFMKNDVYYKCSKDK